jgi:hypothetical protein
VVRLLVRTFLALAGFVLLTGMATAAWASTRQCGAIVYEVKKRIGVDLHMGDAATLPGEGNGGRDFERYVASIAQRCGQYVIGMLVHELADSDDLVRLYAAEALGDIGPRARRAVPALKAALKLDKCWCLADGICQKPSWSSTIAIHEALVQIVGSSANEFPIYNCDYSGGLPFRPGG